jgi:hypothetical protein
MRDREKPKKPYLPCLHMYLHHRDHPDPLLVEVPIIRDLPTVLEFPYLIALQHCMTKETT